MTSPEVRLEAQRTPQCSMNFDTRPYTTPSLHILVQGNVIDWYSCSVVLHYAQKKLKLLLIYTATCVVCSSIAAV